MKELQPANNQLNEEPESLMVNKVRIQLSETQDSTDETDYKHSTQSIMTELDSPVIMSGLNSGLILQNNSVLKEKLVSEMNNNELQKSLAYINDLERILDCNAEQYYNKNSTITSNSSDYAIEHEVKNSTITHNAPLHGTGTSSVVSEASMSVVPELSASHVSYPANVSLPSEHTQTTGNTNHVKRSPSSRSARNLYPNVVIISYDSDDEVTEQEREGVSDESKYGDNTETEEFRTASQTLFQSDLTSETQENFAAHKQNTDMEDSRINAELTKQSPSPPPFSPPLPPPLPPPFTAFPLSLPQTLLTSSSVGEIVAFEGDSDASPTRNNVERHDEINSKKDITPPVTPDPKFLLRMGSLKTSDFASKLEAVLQEKLHDVKYDTRSKSPQLVAKNPNNAENNDNTRNLKRHWSVVNTDTNEQWNGMAGNRNDSMIETDLTQSQGHGKSTDREMELAEIKGKLEQFLASRADVAVLPKPLSHQNAVSLATESTEMKHESDAQLGSKQLPKGPLLNGTKTLKLNHENNHFDTMRKQRLLMGEVLASIKFVASKNRADSESSISDAGEDDVFEDLTSHTEVSVKVGQ